MALVPGGARRVTPGRADSMPPLVRGFGAAPDVAAKAPEAAGLPGAIAAAPGLLPDVDAAIVVLVNLAVAFCEFSESFRVEGRRKKFSPRRGACCRRSGDTAQAKRAIPRRPPPAEAPRGCDRPSAGSRRRTPRASRSGPLRRCGRRLWPGFARGVVNSSRSFGLV